MKIIKQSHSFEHPIDGQDVLKRIELAGRTCWRSEDMAGKNTEKFVRAIMDKNHESVLEHVSFSVRFVTDRGVTHELVRHRLCAFSQESTRYCNYSKDKFGNEIQVILPVEFYDVQEPEKFNLHSGPVATWAIACREAESRYMKMLEEGASPQLARSVLPNCLKTEIVVTANIREWRHILKLRTSKAAHPQIRALMKGLLADLKAKIPVMFDDIVVE